MVRHFWRVDESVPLRIVVTIAGATQSAYNGKVSITVTSSTQFTYKIWPSSAPNPATNHTSPGRHDSSDTTHGWERIGTGSTHCPVH